ncbi:MAG: ABC transporter ATP-binding protein [Alphaproteobacteria bacterium]|nr:ABC transporter ATP-binding protein [Alphaproteobacteria bacterium]
MQLTLDELRHSFARGNGGAPVLDIDRLVVDAGTFFAITGPSGSGKSTLLYLMSGLLKPGEGRIAWDGAEIGTLGEDARDAWRRRNAGFVFQNFHLIGEMTPLQNVMLGAWFGHWRAARFRDRARALLDGFGVPPADRPAETLSRGEQQRVALARALLFEPKVLFADEPTASLDAENGGQIAGLLAELAHARGVTVIAVSHDRDVIALADRTIRLEHGRVAAPEALSR